MHCMSRKLLLHESIFRLFPRDLSEGHVCSIVFANIQMRAIAHFQYGRFDDHGQVFVLNSINHNSFNFS